MDEGAQGRSELIAFVVDGRRWALPLATVVRAVPMVAVTPLPDAPEAVMGALNLHGELVPVFDLRARAGLPAREPGPGDHLLLARTGRLIALPVDEVLGVLALPVEALPEAGPGGVAVLPDGLVVVGDLDAFLSAEEEARLDLALAEAAS
jgi:purine-binding chemotaxis protein CheW